MITDSETAVAPLVRNSGRWRAVWLGVVASLFCAEVAGIVALFGAKFHAELIDTVFDIAALTAIVVVVGLCVRLFPATRRGNVAGATVVVVAFGSLHWLISLFGAAAAIFYLVAQMPPPLRLPFTDPVLTLSLLSSTGVTGTELTVVLLTTFAGHLLLYAPVGRITATAMRRAAAAGLRLPGARRVPVIALAPLYLAAFGLVWTALPASYLMLEPVHRSLYESFEMAPPELTLASAASRRVLPGPSLPHPRR